MLWAQDEYRLDGSDRVLQKRLSASMCRCGSSSFRSWLKLPSGDGASARASGPGLPGRTDRHCLSITTMHFVPSMLQIFLHAADLSQCTSLRRVLCSGEALPFALQQQFHAALLTVELHNLYGPTEAAVDVTAWHCQPGVYNGIVPIGRPVANTSIYVLDSHLQPVPLGVARHEIYIGGVQVARGYLNKPEMSAERFVADPFSTRANARMYKTGDLGRWLADGNIDYIGRNDFQVKLRGFRIELGEIETVLKTCAGVLTRLSSHVKTMRATNAW
ncbi:AMP-binding protein [Massilia sp. H-1]|nr:AMP-binding protein [Massilia sp. H-1]